MNTILLALAVDGFVCTVILLLVVALLTAAAHADEQSARIYKFERRRLP